LYFLYSLKNESEKVFFILTLPVLCLS